MAGNKKPRKKMGKLGPSGATIRAAVSKHARMTNEAEARSMRIRINNLTRLGDPIHAHKIDSTFAQLEAAIDKIDATGSIEADENGDPCMTHPDGETSPLGPALVSTAYIFRRLKKQFPEWPPMPNAMHRVGKRLCEGKMIDDSDIAATRKTIAWMRVHIADVTPIEWSEACDHALAESDAKLP